MTPLPLTVTAPAWLWALPLAALPWADAAQAALPVLRFSHLALWPADAASRAVGLLLRGAASVAIAALVLALAEPALREGQVAREGRGAEIALVLDRSRSMDQSQLSSTGPMVGYNPTYSLAARRGAEERMTKAEIARRELSAFAARRRNDQFAMVVFSARPLKVLEFTQKQDAIQAAIEAGAVGRGIANTDIAQALFAGLALFEHRAYTGSRVLMLVSDGGDHIAPDVRARLARQLQQYRVSLVWIYLRSPLSPGLEADPGTTEAAADTVPEIFLHRFFRSLATPYRAYEAGTPQALQQAIAEVDRLENLPITYLDTLPRRSLAPACLAVALAATALLLWAAARGIRRWT